MVTSEYVETRWLYVRRRLDIRHKLIRNRLFSRQSTYINLRVTYLYRTSAYVDVCLKFFELTSNLPERIMISTQRHFKYAQCLFRGRFIGCSGKELSCFLTTSWAEGTQNWLGPTTLAYRIIIVCTTAEIVLELVSTFRLVCSSHHHETVIFTS